VSVGKWVRGWRRESWRLLGICLSRIAFIPVGKPVVAQFEGGL
jgi:hypothetical protein